MIRHISYDEVLHLKNTILEIWESSVVKTHTFLSNQDILNLKPMVEQYIFEIETLIIFEEDNIIKGFMGIENEKLEMLFLSPNYIKKGIGKKLLLYAINELKVKYVDVNEQNSIAYKFYESFNFKVYKRSPVDSLGYDFPILHLNLLG